MRTDKRTLVWMLILSLGALTALATDVRVKPFHRDTELSHGGKAVAAIVAPTHDKALAEAVEIVTKAIGADADVVDQAASLDLTMEIREDLRARNVVLVGNALDNAAVRRLHHLELALADNNYPGKGGWIVRVLVDPWGMGSNVVIVAGSDAKGTTEAARQFAAAVKEADGARMLPWAWRFQSGKNDRGGLLYAPRRFGDKAWKEFRDKVTFKDQPIAFYPDLAFSAAVRAGREYLANGGRDEIRCFRMAVAEVRKLGDRIKPMRKLEFRLKNLTIAWECLEADPDFSYDDRCEMASYFLFLGKLFEDKYWNNGAPESTKKSLVTTNHVSNGNLGYLRMALYLRERCALAPQDARLVDKWIANSDMLFDAQDDSYRSGCDANGYQWWTNKHMTMYALWRPDYDLFWNGSMRLLADIIFATADNMGNAAKFGDTGAGLTGFSSHAHYLLTQGTQCYHDGRQRWISKFLNRGSRYMRLDTPPMEPVDLYGVFRVPMSRTIYLQKTEMNKEPGWMAVPWGESFDKISFRAGSKPETPYMLLDGMGGMGHGQDDCNGITRVTARGRIWLIDAAYDLKTMYDHNGVFVARDGQAEAPADLAALTVYADLPTFGATRSVSPANGLEWNRNILWDKSGFFVVVDDMRCEKSGDYQANSIWRLPMEARLDGDRLTAVDANKRFVIASGGEGRGKVAWEGVERALGARAFALRQVVSRKMKKGDDFAYAHLLCWPGDDAAQPALTRIGRHAWRVDGLESPAVVAIGGGVKGAIDTDAEMLRLGPDSLALVGATRCRVGGEDVFRAAKPVNMELRVDGTATVVAGEEATTIETPRLGELTRILASGETRDGAKISLNRGSSHLTFRDSDALRAALAGALKAASAMKTERTGGKSEAALTETPALWRYKGVRVVEPLRVAAVSTDIPCPKGRSSPVDKLIDGANNRSTVSSMWGDGQSPTVTFDLGEATTLERIEVYSWDGLKGCKLGKMTVAVSASETAEDFRDLDVAFSEPRKGDRDIARIRELDDLNVQARFVRIQFHPAAENQRVYVSEVAFVPTPDAGGSLTDINDIVVHDLDGDGKGEVLLAGSDGKVHCLGADGKRRWAFETGDIVQDVWAGEIDGKTAIFVGSEDKHLYRLDNSGKEVWRAKTYGYQPRAYEDGGIRCLTVASLQPGAAPVVIVGADNWHVSLFSTDGKEITHCYFYSHESTFLDVGDINGDKNLEIFQGSSFAHVNWFDTHAKESHFIWDNIGPAADGVIADLHGDGKGTMIGAGQQGLAASSIETPVLWRIDTGSPQTCIEAVDLNGDGVEEVVSGGKNGFLWALGAGGKKVWLRNAGDSVNGLVVARHPAAKGPIVLTACDDGAVKVWSAKGEPVGRLGLGSQVTRVAVGDLDGDGAPEVFAVTIDGTFHALSLPKGEVR